MSKYVFIPALLAMSFAVGASAAPQSVAPQDAHTMAASTSQTAPSDTAKPASRVNDRNCIRSTGSLIPAKPGKCLPVAGSSYSKQDLDSTGQTRIGPALQNLDPSISVRGR